MGAHWLHELHMVLHCHASKHLPRAWSGWVTLGALPSLADSLWLSATVLNRTLTCKPVLQPSKDLAWLAVLCDRGAEGPYFQGLS
jgi:hypothetical protein